MKMIGREEKACVGGEGAYAQAGVLGFVWLICFDSTVTKTLHYYSYSYLLPVLLQHYLSICLCFFRLGLGVRCQFLGLVLCFLERKENECAKQRRKEGILPRPTTKGRFDTTYPRRDIPLALSPGTFSCLHTAFWATLHHPSCRTHTRLALALQTSTSPPPVLLHLPQPLLGLFST